MVPNVVHPTSLRWIVLLQFVWVAFVFFGSWFPFEFRSLSTKDATEVWNRSLNEKLSLTDVMVNLAVGVPTGALIAFFCLTRNQPKSDRWYSIDRLVVIVIGGLAGALIAVPVEFGQMFFGRRDSSLFDVLAQTAGASIAALIVGMQFEVCTSLCNSAYNAWLPTPKSVRYLAPIAFLYVLLQTWPWIPAISPSEIASKLREIREYLQEYRVGERSIGLSQVLSPQLLGMGVCAIPFGFILSGLLRRHCSTKSLLILGIIALLVTCSFELGKLFIETRNISIEGAAGSLIGMLVGMVIFRLSGSDSVVEADTDDVVEGQLVAFTQRHGHTEMDGSR